MKFYTRDKNRGFTLVELMVTISIIGILTSIVLANMNSARKSARDAQRKSDLTNLKSAIELYRQKTGKYPDPGCGVGANAYATEKACGAGSPYILGLTPDYISTLPKDPYLGSNEGYSYAVNSTRTVFKLLSMNTAESGENMSATSKFKSCDIAANGICTAPSIVVAACSDGNSRFEKSFGVWGGYADVVDASVKTETAKTLCI